MEHLLKLERSFSKRDNLSMIFYIAKGVIRGQTRLQKMIFIVQKEVGLGDFAFKPHVYGPYSSELEHLLKDMINSKLIKIKEDFDYAYALLQEKPAKIMIASRELIEHGRKKYHELYKENFAKALLFAHKVRASAIMPITQLLAYIYANYPEYSINSIIKERVETWRKLYRMMR